MAAAFAPEWIALALALAGGAALAALAGLARSKLRRLERDHALRVAQAYDAVPTPIVVIARDDGAALQMNPALLDLFGASSVLDEALRARIASLGPALAGVAEPPDSAPLAAIEIEQRFERLDGQLFWAVVRATRDPLAARPAWLCTLTDVTALQQARERLGEVATTDALTAVLNRRGLEQRLRVEWLRAERDGTALSLLRIDVDELRRLQDHYGHETADLALAMAAATCSEALRPTDLLGRWTADAFVAVLPGARTNAALDVAERLKDRVAALDVPVHRADGSVRTSTHVSLSIGAVTAGDDDSTPDTAATGLPSPEELLAQAEAALGAARRVARRAGPTATSRPGDLSR
jgi:diguanylate cyclase (GGDEF)-like protein